MKNTTQQFEYIVKVVEKAYRTGAKAERQRCINIIKAQMKAEIPPERSPSFNGVYAFDKKQYEKLIKTIENEGVD